MIYKNKFTEEEVTAFDELKEYLDWNDSDLDTFIGLIKIISDCKHDLVNSITKAYGFIQMRADWAQSLHKRNKTNTLGDLSRLSGAEQIKFFRSIFYNNHIKAKTKKDIIACTLNLNPKAIPGTIYNTQLQYLPQYKFNRNLPLENFIKDLDKIIEEGKP